MGLDNYRLVQFSDIDLEDIPKIRHPYWALLDFNILTDEKKRRYTSFYFSSSRNIESDIESGRAVFVLQGMGTENFSVCDKDGRLTHNLPLFLHSHLKSIIAGNITKPYFGSVGSDRAFEDVQANQERYAAHRASILAERDNVDVSLTLNECKTAISGVLCNKFSDIKQMTHARNTQPPQGRLPDNIICKLYKTDDEYFIRSLNGRVHENPKGKVIFAILEEDPLSIFCFEMSRLYAHPDFSNRLNDFGHSSLAFKDNWRAILRDEQLPDEDKPFYVTKPVLLAGTMTFPKMNSRLRYEPDGYTKGQLISWSNDSGHFKPTLNQAKRNRFGCIKKFLPMEKFIEYRHV